MRKAIENATVHNRNESDKKEGFKMEFEFGAKQLKARVKRALKAITSRLEDDTNARKKFRKIVDWTMLNRIT